MVEILSLQLQPIGSSVFRAETPSFGQKSSEISVADTAAGKSISWTFGSISWPHDKFEVEHVHKM